MKRLILVSLLLIILSAHSYPDTSELCGKRVWTEWSFEFRECPFCKCREGGE